ncbi:MAG TPA: shikimate kinase, partial [Terriglobia bacterium]|nr:shikimate kinase [Terriglobia bacterium]
TFAQKPNLDFILETGGTTIWLDCSIEELRQRCAGMTNRPLFRDPESFRRLFNERLPYYQRAEHRVVTDGREPQEIVEEILHLGIL